MLGKGPYQERSNSLPRTLVKDNYPGQYRLTKSNYKYQRQQNQPRTKYIPARKITHRQIRPWINLSLCFNVLRSISLSSSHCPFKEDTSPTGVIVWILRRIFYHTNLAMSMARWQLTRLTWLLRPNLRRVSISLFASRRHPYDAISLHSSIPFITSTRYSFHYFFLSIPLQLSFFVGGWQRMRQDSLPISHDFFFSFQSTTQLF